jgi:hypothetical protein
MTIQPVRLIKDARTAEMEVVAMLRVLVVPSLSAEARESSPRLDPNWLSMAQAPMSVSVSPRKGELVTSRQGGRLASWQAGRLARRRKRGKLRKRLY